MLFNSEPYLFFLPAVVAATWILPSRLRPAFLLLASYYFYAYWSPPFLLLIVGLTVANYFIGRAQGRQSPRRRSLLVAAVSIDLGALAVFKYLGLLDQTADQVAGFFGLPASLPAVHIILPLGLSFFTFEFIHYQVDLYRGGSPILNPVHFALFPAFFPTQIAGPIKRFQDFNAQLLRRPRFDSALFLEGIELISLGLFKKVVLADNLLPVAQTVFSAPAEAGRIDAWVGLVAFSFQIYLDFSGYTDIGRGSAQLLGYRVPINFDAPYLTTSIREFWRRWHMSLSSWLRDYLYIPLGGSRCSPARNRLNLMITMTLGGLWHGAAWHFLVWGFGQGLALVGDRLWHERVSLPRLPRAVEVGAGWVGTQLTVLFLWSLFRSPTLESAWTLWQRLIAGGPSHLVGGRRFLVALVAVSVLLVQVVLRRWQPRQMLARAAAGAVLRPAYVGALAIAFTYAFAAASGAQGGPHKFIYFQF